MEDPNVKFMDLLEPTVILQILLNLPQDDLINFAAVNTRIRNVFRQPNVKLEYYKKISILKVRSREETEFYLSINPEGFLYVGREFRLDEKDIKDFGDRVLYLDTKCYCFNHKFPNLKKWTFYDWNRIKIQNNYKDGKKEGKQYKWHLNETKSGEKNYKNGKKEGKQYTWHSNGRKRYEYNYKNGEKDCKQYRWYENGQKDYEYNYKDGKKHGKQYEWHTNGAQKTEENYKDGEKDGKQYEWYKNGEKEAESNFKDGKRDGKQYKWVFY